uniref:Putative secreted protein n=1 Tax=Ixodes ricinus TaxID=34613 RepID=A0A6B0UEL4_IXORI
MPWSMYLFTTLLISFLSLSVISVLRGFMSCPIMERMSWPPWGLALATSRSCKVTSWMTSFFLCTSPFGSGTYSSASRSNSVAYASDLPCLFTAPLLASM